MSINRKIYFLQQRGACEEKRMVRKGWALALPVFKWEEVIFKYVTEALKSMMHTRKLEMHLNALYYGKLAIFLNSQMNEKEYHNCCVTSAFHWKCSTFSLINVLY